MRCASGSPRWSTEAAMLREELLEARMDAANAAANAIAGLRRDVVPWQEPSTALVAWRRQRAADSVAGRMNGRSGPSGHTGLRRRVRC